MIKSRLPSPSEISALDFKGNFRRFEICTVSGQAAVLLVVKSVLNRLIITLSNAFFGSICYEIFGGTDDVSSIITNAL